MTFGLLSAAQMAIVVALTGAAVLAIFFLKVRHPLVIVPSLVLWQRVLDEHRRDSLIERLRRVISLLIALAIAWLLALAAGEPRPAGGSGGRLALVIDNGPSMNAEVPGGETRLERARDAARALVDRAGGDARFQVADTTGAVRTPPDLDRRQALEAIERIRPGFGPPRTPAAAGGYEPVYFTDGARLDPPAEARVVSLAGPAPNVGITAFEIRSTPSRPAEHTAYLSVVNFDTVTRDVDLTIGAPGRPRVRRSMPLAAGAALRQTLPMHELDPGVVEARITSAEDRVPLDDVAFGWLPGRQVSRVVLVTTGQPALASVLEADPRVSLQVVAPGAYRASLEADILVFDRVTPDAAPRQPALLFGPTAAGWLPLGPQTRTLPSLVVSDADHPLMASVTLDDLHVTRTAVLTAPGAAMLAGDAGQAVLAAGRTAAPWVAVGFALDDSNFAAQASFPIFVANALTWFRGEADPLTVPPGLVHVPGTGHTVVDLDGREMPVRALMDSTTFTAEGPGVYFATARGVRRPIVVTLAETDWTAAVSVRDGVSPAPAAELPATSSRPWWTLLAMTALVLLAAEWWTWQRRITV
jgi:hypothetical protein